MTRRDNTRKILVWLIAAFAGAAAPAAGQQRREPIGRFVVDARVTSAGLPGDQGWTPVLPPETETPSRALGLNIGAHVYVLRFKSLAIGAGASWDTGRGTVAPPDIPEGTTTPVVQGPEVTTRLTSFAPQVSVNFGHSLGWSYISGGIGRTRVESSAQAVTGTAQYVPVDSGWTKAINYGGGARWFINEHVGVSFDLRWYNLSIVEPSATSPGAPRASLLTAAVGVSLK
jgi:hypothetical protein